jgi:hypothetical protein
MTQEQELKCYEEMMLEWEAEKELIAMEYDKWLQSDIHADFHTCALPACYYNPAPEDDLPF